MRPSRATAGLRHAALTACLLGACSEQPTAPAGVQSNPMAPSARSAIELRSYVSETLTVPGALNFSAMFINDLGVIAGTAQFGGPATEIVIWTDAGAQRTGVYASDIVGLNGPGQFAYNAGGRAFLWADGSITDLGTLGGDRTRARGMNDPGQVVGESRTAEGFWHAFLWEAGTMTDLGPGTARGINDLGQILLHADGIDGPGYYLWEDGTRTFLFDRGEPPGNCFWKTAESINDRGQVFGQCNAPDGVEDQGAQTAYVWEAGTVTIVGWLAVPNACGFGGWTVFGGHDDTGRIVGRSADTDASGACVQRPYLFEHGRLFALGPAENGDALDVNARGWIVGQSSLGATLWLPRGDMSSRRPPPIARREALKQGKGWKVVMELELFNDRIQKLVRAGDLDRVDGADLVDTANSAIAAVPEP